MFCVQQGLRRGRQDADHGLRERRKRNGRRRELLQPERQTGRLVIVQHAGVRAVPQRADVPARERLPVFRLRVPSERRRNGILRNVRHGRGYRGAVPVRVRHAGERVPGVLQEAGVRSPSLLMFVLRTKVCWFIEDRPDWI